MMERVGAILTVADMNVLPNKHFIGFSLNFPLIIHSKKDSYQNQFIFLFICDQKNRPLWCYFIVWPSYKLQSIETLDYWFSR